MAKLLPKLPELLLDRNLSGRQLRRLLSTVKWPVKSQGEMGYPKDATDQLLLEQAGRAKHLFVTADKNIKFTPVSVQAILDNKVAVLFVSGNENPMSIFSALWLARGELLPLVERQGAPLYIELTTTGVGIATLSKLQPGSSKPKRAVKKQSARSKTRTWKTSKSVNQGQASMFEGLDGLAETPGAQA
jgi:hypothetical protein